MSPSEWIERARHFVSRELWEVVPERRSRLSAVRLLQFVIMLAEGFVRDRLLLRASALTYFTVLSLVPLVAVAVAIAGAVGVGSESFVDWVVGTVAGGAPEAEDTIRRLIREVDFTGLGTVGGGLLLVTTVLAISNVERTLNDIWGVASGRTWLRRFTDYLAVLLVSPLLAGLALSIVTTLRSRWAVSHLALIPGLGIVENLWAALVPMGMLSAAFVFLYAFLPNTRVKLGSAAIGGVVAGVLVALAQTVYVEFSVGVVRASTFFAGFALLPLLFAWIYVFWAIVLLGAEIAFAHQNFALYRKEVHSAPATPAEREAIALQIALDVARCFGERKPAPHAEALADDLQVPVRTVRAVAAQLVDAGILSTRVDATQELGFQLGRPAESITATDVLAAVRGWRKPIAGHRATGSTVAHVLDEIESAAHKGAGDSTLAELLRGRGAAQIDPPAARG